MPLFDAHNHLQDARLAPIREEFIPELERLGVQCAVVNGTSEDDWAETAMLAAQHAWIRPAFGLHPWRVPGRTSRWQERLLQMLDANPRAAIGEIGLDRWIEGHNLQEQSDAFEFQLAISAERNLPVTIHCIQAWGALWEILRTHPLPARGFLLHAYGGPLEMVPGFVERGAYFSFSPYFLHERKALQRTVFAAIPADRLLVETDAPELRPPDARNAHPLQDHNGEPLNHPANLLVAYDGLAEVRQLARPAIDALGAENFRRLFGS